MRDRVGVSRVHISVRSSGNTGIVLVVPEVRLPWHVPPHEPQAPAPLRQRVLRKAHNMRCADTIDQMKMLVWGMENKRLKYADLARRT